MLQEIADTRICDLILHRAKQLEFEPEKQGKPLLGELAGLRSLRAAGQRYRILYRVERARIVVLVVAVGIRRNGSRRDIHALARKLLKAGLVE